MGLALHRALCAGGGARQLCSAKSGAVAAVGSAAWDGNSSRACPESKADAIEKLQLRPDLVIARKLSPPARPKRVGDSSCAAEDKMRLALYGRSTFRRCRAAYRQLPAKEPAHTFVILQTRSGPTLLRKHNMLLFGSTASVWSYCRVYSGLHDMIDAVPAAVAYLAFRGRLWRVGDHGCGRVWV